MSLSNLHWLPEDYFRHPKKMEEYSNDKKGNNVAFRTISSFAPLLHDPTGQPSYLEPLCGVFRIRNSFTF